MPVVYAIRCTNGYHYVGCTAGSLTKRMREHRSLLNAGNHSSRKLQKDWERFGDAAFECIALEACSATASVMDKRIREMFWMQKFSSLGKLYNQYQTSFQPKRSSAMR